MKITDIMKYAALADGVLMAALTELGRLAPEDAIYTGPAIMILGTLGTLLGGIHLANQKKAA